MAKIISMGALAGEIKKSLINANIEAKEKANKAIFKATVKVWGSILKMTPVDTGRARSNWFIGMNVGSELVESTTSKGTGYIKGELPKNIFGTKVYLYNNLPYIQALEYGHSEQAAKGMVRISLLGWESALSKAFKEA